jgi:hypothetical protein
MKYLVLAFFFMVSAAGAQQHCGYDFTSYIVLHVHENGKKENIADLKITVVDSTGADVVNTANKYSWKMKNEPLRFSENYKIDAEGNKIASEPAEKFRWFFPFAKDTYLLSVTNDFPADAMRVKIEGGGFKTNMVQLYAFNMYILCSTQAQQQAQQFGPRVNKPVDIVLEKASMTKPR